MLLKTWPGSSFRTGSKHLKFPGDFADRKILSHETGRAAKPGQFPLRACKYAPVILLKMYHPPRTPRRFETPANRLPTSLGAPVKISYAATMRETTDEQLMQRYAQGDASAFEQLYCRHRGALYRYFRRQVANAATANDLYQGAWEKIIRARLKYRPSAPFTVWMYRIAHNHLVDYYRRMRPAESIRTDTYPDGRPGPVQDAIDEEQNEQLRAGIRALPDEQRNTLLLKLESGLKMKDIARVTGVSRETVKSRLRYALDKLKRSLIE